MHLKFQENIFYSWFVDWVSPTPVVVVFYVLSAVTSWLFLRLARYWQVLLRAFRFQERRHGACLGLRARLRCISLTLFVVSFGESEGASDKLFRLCRNDIDVNIGHKTTSFRHLASRSNVDSRKLVVL